MYRSVSGSVGVYRTVLGFRRVFFIASIGIYLQACVRVDRVIYRGICMGYLQGCVGVVGVFTGVFVWGIHRAICRAVSGWIGYLQGYLYGVFAGLCQSG